MKILKTRIDRLELAAALPTIVRTNWRWATDAQLEALLRSNGIDPLDELQLYRAATTERHQPLLTKL